MPNPFNTAFDAMAAPVFAGAGLADSATFRRKNSAAVIDCTVLVDDAVQFVGDVTQVVDGKKQVTAYFAEIGSTEPVFGDLFMIDGEKWSVDSVLNRDASRVVCIVSKR